MSKGLIFITLLTLVLILDLVFVLNLAGVIVLPKIKIKTKIKKKPVLIVLISLAVLLLSVIWRNLLAPLACYSGDRWSSSEAPEIAKDLSSDDRIAIVEYIRDHISEARSPDDSVPEPGDRVYVIYGYKAWQSVSDSTTEIDSGISILMRPENNLSAGDHAYDIHFQSIKAGLVCVGVHHKYSPFYPTRSHGFYDYIWAFGKSFFGIWELFTILPDGIV
jgi:energy-coupling factor transporter transmembrane protein EcfT